MITAKSKKMNVLLKVIEQDFGRNVREPVKEKYDSPSLREDIERNGIETPLWLERKEAGKDGFNILRGNKRFYNVSILAAQGKIDPKTMDYDAKGEPIPNTGKVFSSVPAEVYEPLSDMDRYLLTFDQGNISSLDRSELVRAAFMGFDVGLDPKNVQIAMGDLLYQHFPVKATTKGAPTQEELVQQKRGTMQWFHNCYRMPLIARDDCVKSLKNLQKWPSREQAGKLYAAHVQDAKADQTGMTGTIENPGPKFLELWQKILDEKAKKEAGETGAERKTTMMTRKDLEDHWTASASKILKLHSQIVLRNANMAVAPKLDAFMVLIEKAFSPEQTAQMVEMLGAITKKSEEKEAE